MARKAISQRTQKKETAGTVSFFSKYAFKETAGTVSFFSKYAFVIRDWTKRRSISGGIYKKNRLQ